MIKIGSSSYEYTSKLNLKPYQDWQTRETLRLKADMIRNAQQAPIILDALKKAINPSSV